MQRYSNTNHSGIYSSWLKSIDSAKTTNILALPWLLSVVWSIKAVYLFRFASDCKVWIVFDDIMTRTTAQFHWTPPMLLTHTRKDKCKTRKNYCRFISLWGAGNVWSWLVRQWVVPSFGGELNNVDIWKKRNCLEATFTEFNQINVVVSIAEKMPLMDVSFCRRTRNGCRNSDFCCVKIWGLFTILPVVRIQGRGNVWFVARELKSQLHFLFSSEKRFSSLVYYTGTLMQKCVHKRICSLLVWESAILARF